ncbi:MAG: hypothetical protein OEM25_00770 [Gammaproteobacteria bacterium]|nr:hypothetical protein [Gammaproteobacteria bacterium]
MQQIPFKQLAKRELALFLGLLFAGFVLVPVPIYLVGQNVLGEFGGNGYGDFFGTLSAKIRGGDLVAWFFVLAPYFAWQVMRLTLRAWRAANKVRD